MSIATNIDELKQVSGLRSRFNAQTSHAFTLRTSLAIDDDKSICSQITRSGASKGFRGTLECD